MAWSSYDTPAGTGERVLLVQFKDGTALLGRLDVQSTDAPSDAQYQAVVDSLNASALVQTAHFTETNSVSRMLTMTPPEG